MTEAFDTLRDEHQQLRSLLARLLSTTDDAPGVRTRLDLIDAVRSELLAHDADAVEPDDRLNEHAELEQWVEELMSMPPSDPMWLASFESFAAALVRHLSMDERVVVRF